MRNIILASNAYLCLDRAFDLFPKGLLRSHAGFIPTAAQMYKTKPWLVEDRNKLISMGMEVTDIDLHNKDYGQLKSEIAGMDVIFVAGGNVFYLLQKTRDSGFDRVVKESVEAGVLYIGSSAGSVLAGPDIGPMRYLDDPATAPNLASTVSLGLVDFIPFPHWGNIQYKTEYSKTINKYYEMECKIIPLRDDQAVVVHDRLYTVI